MGYTWTALKPGFPSLFIVVIVFCKIFHVAVFAVFDTPTIIVEWRELFVSYSSMTFVNIMGIGYNNPDNLGRLINLEV